MKTCIIGEDREMYAQNLLHVHQQFLVFTHAYGGGRLGF